MLADHREAVVQAGGLDPSLHFPSAWRWELLEFIATELPKWRDDPKRPPETAEAMLTSRLCAHLNSATRRSRGWDFLQFRSEEPDEVVAGRKFDLVPAPSAATIWIEGREYTQYMPLVPIECKRLPTPSSSTRDEREYLYSSRSSTGGVQRFKAGHHGAAHLIGAMIAYIQSEDIDFWNNRISAWINDLSGASIEGWSSDDKFRITKRDAGARYAKLESVHKRSDGLSDIQLQHLWIDMATLSSTPAQ
jgi:hypothetical protein